MKIIQSLLIVCIAIALQTSASASPFWGKNIKPNGDIVTETFNIPSSSYDRIEASSSAKVRIVEGSGDIVVKIDSNVLPYLVVKVSDGKMKIGLDRDTGTRGELTFEVLVPHNGDLVGLSASSGASIESEVVLDGEKVELDASSGGDLFAITRGGKCYLEASSGSDIDVECKSQILIARSSSGADINVDIESDKCDGHASSGSGITLTGKVNHADLSASSGGRISARELIYETIDVSESSGGSVRRQKNK